jgi:hypothetical protein
MVANGETGLARALSLMGVDHEYRQERLPTHLTPRSAHRHGACARRGGSRYGGLVSNAAGEDQPGGRQISGYAEGRPALRRLHALPTAERVQSRPRRNQPDRLALRRSIISSRLPVALDGIYRPFSASVRSKVQLTGPSNPPLAHFAVRFNLI